MEDIDEDVGVPREADADGDTSRFHRNMVTKN
jgi:hypothetical protein